MICRTNDIQDKCCCIKYTQVAGSMCLKVEENSKKVMVKMLKAEILNL